jgi:hypothetical protein
MHSYTLRLWGNRPGEPSKELPTQADLSWELRNFGVVQRMYRENGMEV